MFDKIWEWFDVLADKGTGGLLLVLSVCFILPMSILLLPFALVQWLIEFSFRKIQ